MTETMVIKSVIQQVDPIASRIELPTIFFVVYNGRKSNGLQMKNGVSFRNEVDI